MFGNELLVTEVCKLVDLKSEAGILYAVVVLNSFVILFENFVAAIEIRLRGMSFLVF